MKFIFRSTTLIILTCILALSCKKSSVEPFIEKQQLKTQSGIVNTREGVLSFGTVEELNQKIDELKEMTEEQLEVYNQNSTSYTSLYQHYKNMDKLAEEGKSISASKAQEDKIIANIQDDYFATLVNKDGLLICGDNIYRYGADYYQISPLASTTDISNINWDGIEKQSQSKTYNYGETEWASFSPNSKFMAHDGNGVLWHKVNNKPVRAVHTVWCSYYVVYSSIGSKIKFERDSWAGWINIKHYSASNFMGSPIRVLELLSGGGQNSLGQPTSGGGWVWDYKSVSGSKITTNQNVNQIIKQYSYMIGQIIQHKVGGFVSTVTISNGTQMVTSSWTN